MKSPLRYAIVIETTKTGFSVHAPDLPGCVATGSSVEEAEKRMRGAIEMHLSGLREDKMPIPKPSIRVEYVEVPA